MLALPVEGAGLRGVRAAVQRLVRQWLVPEPTASDLVLVAHELATNVVRYGGGIGDLTLWVAEEFTAPRLYCRVRDTGPGLVATGIADPAHLGLRLPDPGSPSGRGLWLVRQMSDQVTIETSPAGTTVTTMVTPDWRPRLTAAYTQSGRTGVGDVHADDHLTGGRDRGSS
jgi:anti-sigma regulatory factor (Ser/Thr protein kinase)